MLVRFFRSSFARCRCIYSSPVAGPSFSSNVATEEANPTSTEVSEQNTNSSKRASSVRDSLSRRLFRMRKSDFGSVVTVIAKYKEERGVVPKSEFISAIRGLDGQHRYADALTVRDSMLDVKDFELNSDDYASHIGFIFKVHGLQSTEKFFDGIPEEMKDRITSAALLKIFVTAGETVKAEALMEKMKESGFLKTFHPYIYMLSLYLSKENFVKADEMATGLMKVIPRDVNVYNMWLITCASGKDVDGAERAFGQMMEANVWANWQTHATLAELYIEKKLFGKAEAALKEMEYVAPSWETACCSLICLHGKMGNKDEVLRIWDVLKSMSSRRYEKGYNAMVQTLLKLDMFEKARDIFNEWEAFHTIPLFHSTSNLMKEYEKNGKMSFSSIPDNTEEDMVELECG